MFYIRVPASTSNLGPGFDSVGLALNLYLELSVTPSNEWEFIPVSKEMEKLPRGESNFIFEVANKVAKRFGKEFLPACKVEMKSDIPLARGFGSSATATLAGIEIANQLLELNLSTDEKLEIATAIEGHPDNVAPSLMGGCIIGHYDQEVDWIKTTLTGVSFLAIVPTYEIKTKYAREVLPDHFTYQASVQASSVANVSVAAIFKQDWALLGKMMEKDLFHQPFRKRLIPHYEEIHELLRQDVYGVFLSGAGPAMIAIAEESLIKKRLKQWRSQFSQYNWLHLSSENQGLEVEYEHTKAESR